MKKLFTSLKQLILRHQFVTAIVVVIGISGVMTSISMFLYIQSGASGLDLSRPGFSSARADLQSDRSATFAPTGSLTEKDMASFDKLFTEKRKYLESLGKFDDEVLSDEALGFTVPEDVSGLE